MVILPPVTNEPCSGIEHRLESVQEARRHSSVQAVAAVNPRSDKSATAAFATQRQRLDAAPDETDLAKATAYHPRNMAPHGHWTGHTPAGCRGRAPYQGPTDTQLTGVKMDAPSTSRAPQEVHLLGVEPQSVGTHPFGDPLNTKLHMTPLLYTVDGGPHVQS